jgi:hypothetical protein
MPKKTTQSNDLTTTIDLFLEELPDAKTSMRSVYLKEFAVGNKKIVLMAQQTKGAQGMSWNIDVRNAN